MRCAAVAALPLFLAGAAWAEGPIDVCYNYGCAVEETVIFSDVRLEMVRKMLAKAQTPEAERETLSAVIGLLYGWAGEQTPIWRDRGGNYDDEQDRSGRMDCIDHSTTTTRFLDMIAARGWLHFHRVLPVERRGRFILDQHFSAVIEELGPVRDPEHPAPERYAVDSWFRDNGEPAAIMPLENWLRGEYPDVQ